jgi:hypothetical protein
MLNLHCILKELSPDFLMGLWNFSATHTYLVLDPIFLQKTANVDNSRLLISTCRFPKLSDQSKSVSHYHHFHSLFPIG